MYDRFGYSVAIDGDTAIVGAYSGSAYIFTRSGSTWTQQAKLLASDRYSKRYSKYFFGTSVAMDGDTAIVGAFDDDDNGDYSGSAYIFTRSGSTWTQQAKLLASDGAAGDGFGRSIAIDGDTAIVNANGDDDNGESSGSAYIFTRSGSTWTQQDKLLASDGASYDYFGRSIAIDTDTAIVGANYDSGNGRNFGSAYIFTRNGTNWTQQTKLLASDGARDNYFGTSVAMDGDTAIVGAYRDDDTGTDSGSAYIFTRSGSSWE